jgi:protein-disulfide isomerase
MNKLLSTLAVMFCVAILSTQAFAADLTDEQFSKLMDSFLAKDANVEKIGNSLEQYFRKKRDEQQQAAEQEEEKVIEEQFKNPVKVDIGKSPVKGSDDAPITIVEFSDFQCPFCSRGAQTLEDVVKEYPGKIKIVFKNLPLPFHPEAKPAAIAALAAGKQGKFWQMHDKLFANQNALGSDLYPALAKELGLDVNKFTKDLGDAELAKQVEEDAALAASLGIQGTPGFFVNGVQIRGARPLPYFKAIVDRWLAKD